MVLPMTSSKGKAASKGIPSCQLSSLSACTTRSFRRARVFKTTSSSSPTLMTSTLSRQGTVLGRLSTLLPTRSNAMLVFALTAASSARGAVDITRLPTTFETWAVRKSQLGLPTNPWQKTA